MSLEFYNAARGFVRAGYKVLPLKSGRNSDGSPADDKIAKQPLPSSNGYKDATDDRAKILQWFGCSFGPGRPYNLGVVPGPDLLILDVDKHKAEEDGEKTVATLARTLGPLPPTWESVTPTGGEHLHFLAPAHGIRRILRNPRIPGLDVIGTTALAVEPPSLRPAIGPEARYCWTPGRAPWEIPRATLPPAWVQALKQIQDTTARPPDNSAPNNYRPPAHSPTSSDLERYRAALWYLSPFDFRPRADWFALMTACKSAGISMEEFRAWSAQDSEKYNRSDWPSQWRSADPAYKGPGFLVQKAKDHGWSWKPPIDNAVLDWDDEI